MLHLPHPQHSSAMGNTYSILNANVAHDREPNAAVRRICGKVEHIFRSCAGAAHQLLGDSKI